MSSSDHRHDPRTVRRSAVDVGRSTPLVPRRPHEPPPRPAHDGTRDAREHSRDPVSDSARDDEPRRRRPPARERHRGDLAGPAPARVPRARPIPALLVLVIAAAGAGLLGYMGQAAGAGAFRGSWEFSRLGGPWLLAGFIGGAIGGWRRGWWGLFLGLLTGAVMVGAGSVVYYGLSWYAGGNDAHRAAKLGIGWGAAGVAIGGVLGLLGAAYATSLARYFPKDGGRPQGSWLHGAAFGTLGGLLMGEAIALLWVWHSTDLRTMAALEGIGGGALVLFGAVIRQWRFFVSALIFAAVSASVAPIATTAVRETLRTIGWAGA